MKKRCRRHAYVIPRGTTGQYCSAFSKESIIKKHINEYERNYRDAKRHTTRNSYTVINAKSDNGKVR